MKKLLYLFLIIPLLFTTCKKEEDNTPTNNTGNDSTQTYVPDDNFENYLESNSMGNGVANDNYVTTANINTVLSLSVDSVNIGVDSLNIADLTGIEGFAALTYLSCSYNQLTSLDVRNGNNTNFTYFNAAGNPNLTCINVDDFQYSLFNWTNIDPQHYFSNNCPPPSSIQEHTTNKELLRTIDVLGRENQGNRNEPLFYIYDDGTVEKKIIIKK